MTFSKYKYIVVLCLVFMMSGCATQMPITKVAKVAESYRLMDICQKYNIIWQWDSVTQVIYLSREEKEAQAMVGSGLVIIDNQRIMLSRPIIMQQSEVIVPSDFYPKVIQRMKLRRFVKKNFKKKSLPLLVKRNVKRIIIDAGHGGKDPGALGKHGLKEKVVVFDIAKRVQSKLKAKGYEAVLSRDSDNFISLQKRTEIASEQKADLFISIHANSAPDRSARGLEVFSARSLTYADKNEHQRAKNHKILYKNYAMKQSNKDLNKIIADMLYVYKQGESDLLAQFVSKRISKDIKVKNRGVKQSKFFVLRNNLMPAVLIEVGFLSNIREEKLLGTTEYRQKMADAIVLGIIDYVKAH
jgi:N-acetylmuramoyl-L-alanine amidase